MPPALIRSEPADLLSKMATRNKNKNGCEIWCSLDSIQQYVLLFTREYGCKWRRVSNPKHHFSVFHHHATPSQPLHKSLKKVYKIVSFVFAVLPDDVLTVRVLAEPVLKYNTAVLRCQVPQSAASYTSIVSWTRGNSHLYQSPKGGKPKPSMQCASKTH